MNIPGRPPGAPSAPLEPFVADLSEGAEAGVYLALLELIDEGLIITGDELILDANSAACTLLEREYRELAGRPLSTLFPHEEAFLDARARLLIQGERRSRVSLALPDGRPRDFDVLCAPRLRPGVHALVLSPTRRYSAHIAPRLDTPEPAAHFAAHLDPGHRLQSRPGSLFDASTWTDEGLDGFEHGLRQALDHDALSLQFQPLIDCRNRQVRAGEALLRWQHPTLGQLPFARFKAAIRDPQLIARLGDWVLNNACRSARTWRRNDVESQRVRLTVNVATEQLLHGDFAECVRLVLEDSDVPPEYLELDLDEKVLETDNADLLATMKALNAMGVRLAIDDFGRGLSSIPRLRRYPLKALKLDPGLVRGVGHDEDSEAVVEAIASLATTLGLEVFARGVETPAQRDFLRALDCNVQQGPLFGAPMNAHAFARSLR